MRTVLRDDPRLTVRLNPNRAPTPNPLRLILDSRLKIPLSCRLLSRRLAGGTIIAATRAGSRRKEAEIRKRGARVWRLPSENGRISLSALLARLRQIGIRSLLVEGGPTLLSRFLRARRPARMAVFFAPFHAGEGASLEPGAAKILQRIPPAAIRWRRLGKDFLAEV